MYTFCIEIIIHVYDLVLFVMCKMFFALTHVHVPDVEEDTLPCEYCQTSFPPASLLSHQLVCDKRPPSLRGKTPRPHRGGGGGGGDSSRTELLPCQFCDQQIPLAHFIKHEVPAHVHVLYIV